jgi:hypothetical protein
MHLLPAPLLLLLLLLCLQALNVCWPVQHAPPAAAGDGSHLWTASLWLLLQPPSRLHTTATPKILLHCKLLQEHSWTPPSFCLIVF